MAAGRAIWTLGAETAIVGNRVHAPEGIKVGSFDNCVSANTVTSGSIILDSGVSGNVVVGNKAGIIDNSASTNTIANNG
jgi:hypothetical protein